MLNVQLDQLGSPVLHGALKARFYALPDVEERQTTVSDPRARAMWLRDVVPLGNPDAFLGGREVGHFHPWDRSMHVVLPMDVARLPSGPAGPRSIRRCRCWACTKTVSWSTGHATIRSWRRSLPCWSKRTATLAVECPRPRTRYCEARGVRRLRGDREAARDEALRAGHEVLAFVRDPGKLGASREGLTIAQARFEVSST